MNLSIYFQDLVLNHNFSTKELIMLKFLAICTLLAVSPLFSTPEEDGGITKESIILRGDDDFVDGVFSIQEESEAPVQPAHYAKRINPKHLC